MAATPDEVQNLILQVEGEQKVRQLIQALKDELKVMDDLRAMLGSVPSQQAMFNKEMDVSRDKVAALAKEILNLQAVDSGSGSGGGGGFQFRGGMRADLILTHLVRTLTDETVTLTAKLERLGAVMPWILNMFGIGGPWAAGLSITTVAVVELYSRWNDLMAALGNEAPRDAAKAIEELAERSKKAIDAFRKNLNQPTAEEHQVQGVYKQMMVGEQGDRMEQSVIDAMIATGTAPGYDAGESQILAAKPRGADDAVRLAALQARIRREAEPRIRAERTKRARHLLGAVQAGETPEERQEARGTLLGLARAAPKAFPAGIPGELEHLTPEGIKADEEASDAAEDAFEEGNEAWRKLKRGNARKRKEAEARKKQDAADMDQGRQMQLRQKAHDEAQAKQFFEHQRHQAERHQGEPTGQELNFVRRTARQMGQDPTNEQVHEMARAAINMNGQGVDAVNAVVLAIQQKINQMDRAAAQWAQLKAQVGRRMGSDQTGAVSMTPNYIQ